MRAGIPNHAEDDVGHVLGSAALCCCYGGPMTQSTQRALRRAAIYTLLWLIIPALTQLGVTIYHWLNPGAAVPADGEAPPSLLYGVSALVVAVIVVLLIGWRSHLGVIWFGIALAVSAVIAALSPILPLPLTTFLLLVAPPIAAALLWRKDAHVPPEA